MPYCLFCFGKVGVAEQPAVILFPSWEFSRFLVVEQEDEWERADHTPPAAGAAPSSPSLRMQSPLSCSSSTSGSTGPDRWLHVTPFRPRAP